MGTAPVITFTDATTAGTPTCAGNYTVTRTWIATDACGNVSLPVSQAITVRDNIAPVLSGQGANATINCPATPSFTAPTATDSCGGTAPVITFTDATTAGTPTCPANYTVTRTWIATDACGNVSLPVSQAITVRDITPPVFAGLPAPTTIANNVTPSFQQAVANDACSSVVLTFVDTPTTPNCNGAYSITRTWTATDLCNNASTASQIINISGVIVVANDDAGATVNGITGGTAFTNVLTNDTLNGSSVVANQVTTSFVSSTHPGITLSGNNVVVAAGTPAGNYTLTYRICAVSATCSCDEAVVSVTVSAAAIVAQNDLLPSTNGFVGNPSVGNVLPNNGSGPDTLNGNPLLNLSAITMTVQTPATPIAGGPVPTLNTTTGVVSVPAGTPAGTYTITYQICENLNPANCDTAIVTIPVGVAAIVAQNDLLPSTNGFVGNPSVGNVLPDNGTGADTLNGNPLLNLSAITMTVQTPATPIAGGPVPTLNTTTGVVSVPAGTPAGTYTITYQICENLNPANCDNAIVTIPVGVAPIVAQNDLLPSTNGFVGNPSVGNVLPDNGSGADTLNGNPLLNLSAITMTVQTPATPIAGGPVPTLNTTTGVVSVPAGTPAGTYTITYQICENLNPANCDNAIVTIPVGVAAIVAQNDLLPSTNGFVGNTNVGNVLPDNGTGPDTLNGNPLLNLSAITMTVQTPATPIAGGPVPTLNTTTGVVSVPAGTPAGTYTITYQICENLNPANCDNAIVTIPVGVAPIVAQNDLLPSTNGFVGNPSVGNVLPDNGTGPDTLNGNPLLNLSAITMTVQTPATPIAGGPVPTLNTTTGVVSVPAGTPAGTYTITYQICENLNPANCDNAIVTIPVGVAAIVAQNDLLPSTNGFVGNTNVGNVLPDNGTGPDTLNGNPLLNLSAITMTVQTPATPIAGGPVPTLNTTTGVVSVPAGTPAGTYTITYQICENLNPANCDTAIVTIPVGVAAIVAQNDLLPSTNGFVGNPSVGNVLPDNGSGADTLNGNPLLNLSAITMTVQTPATPIAGGPVPTLNTTTGVVSVPAGTPAGTYTITYQICENLNPANCDNAIVTIPVGVAAIVAQNDLLPSTNGFVGNPSVGNVLPDNGTGPDTLNGNPLLNLSAITMTVQTPATPIAGGPVPTLNTTTGVVSVPAGTPAGTYTITYQICENLNPLNCDNAIVTIPVGVAPIVAQNDLLPSTNGFVGNTNVGNVLPDNGTGPDTLNGNPLLNLSAITMTVQTPATPIAGGPVPTLNTTTGVVSVPAGTPAGTYTITYQICENLNPANCDNAIVTIPVGVAAIVAQNDLLPSTNGFVGNPSVGNVLPDNGTGPDTLNGNPLLNLSAITMTVQTPATPIAGGPVPTLNTTTGVVSVPAGTPAGTYTITYQICENLNPANCDTAIVTIPVGVAAIVAQNDLLPSTNGFVGNPSVGNVLPDNGTGPDTLNGNPLLNLSAITMTVQTPATPIAGGPVPTLNTTTGVVSVPAGTPAGTYTITYQICENLNPANCDTAIVTIPVGVAAIVAQNDLLPSTNGFVGNPSVGNVLPDNGSGADTLNGNPLLNLSAITMTVQTPATPIAGGPVPTLNTTTGVVSVPAGTPAGTYTITYQICENLNPANCDNAIVTIPVGVAPIVAQNDLLPSTNGFVGNTNVGNVLPNNGSGPDTLNGNPLLNLSAITMTVQTPATPIAGGPVPTLNTTTGVVSVPAGTPAGTYTITYQICENLNPANCDNAIVTIPVGVAPIVAQNDLLPSTNGFVGNTNVGNVLPNNGSGPDTLNGNPLLNLSAITMTVQTPATPIAGGPVPTLNTTTGVVSVPAGTPAGTYTITYQICENLNPSNCDTAIVTIPVGVAAIVAQNDLLPSTNGFVGNPSVGNVLPANGSGPDTLNGNPLLNLSAITMTVQTPATPIAGGPVPTLNTTTGVVSVPAGTPAGTYTITYQICENLNPANCDTAIVTIPVGVAAIVAQNDLLPSTNGFVGNPSVGNVLPDNGTGPDTLNGNPLLNLSAITMTVQTPATPIAGGPVPTLNTTTGVVSVPAGTPAGTYTITYQICENLNPANCDNAIVTIPVGVAAIVAQNDLLPSTNGFVGNTNVGNVLPANGSGPDTLNGNPLLNLSAITMTVQTPATPIAGGPVPTLNTTTGVVSVPAGTPAGTYTITYQICENLNPLNCDNAIVTIPVGVAAIVAQNDLLPSTNGFVGNPSVGNVLPNNGSGPDTLNGNPLLNLSAITMTVQTPATPIAGGPVPTLNTTTGVVSVPAGTPAGTYTITYQICENLNPANCDTAIVTIPVSAATIDAINDILPSTNGATGNANVGNVLPDNGNGPDTLNGNPLLNLSAITMTVQTPATSIGGGPVPTLNTSTGVVSVPVGTPSGTYTITYQICENLNPLNCDTAIVTIPVGVAPIVAQNDLLPPSNGIIGNTNVGNVLPNNSFGPDTLNGNALLDLSAITMTVQTPAFPISGGPVPTLDVTTGVVSVPAGTPQGTYNITYQICENLNPLNCDTAIIIIPVYTPAINLLKNGTYVDSLAPVGVSVGDTVVYNFIVTNTGGSVLTNITVTDPLVTVVGGPLASLAVGGIDTATFSAIYTITQADIDAGQVNNLATATGTPPTGPPVTDTSSDPTPCTTCDPVPNCPTCTSTDLPQTPAIDLLKDGTYVDSSLPAGVSVGDTITYAFTVTNIGNVTLTNVTVTDPLVTVVGGPIPTLAVGASNSTTFTALYTVTQADIDAGQVNNLATATGTPPTGPPVTDTSSDPTPCTTCDPVPNCPTCTSTDLPQTPAIDLLKDGTYVDSSLPAGVSVGDTITYAFTVTNIGNVTLTNVTVTDPLVTVVGGPIPTLAVGASNSTTFTALYTVTQADIDAGQVNNLATATGTPPTGPPVTDTSSDPTPCTTCDPVPNCPTCTSTDLPQTPAIDLLKDGTYVDSSLPAGVSVGDTITYAFTVTNIGNVTLTNVTVTDPLVTVVGGPIPTLAVGASNSTTFTALYTVTQADIDAGQVNNLATATGTPPTGPPVTDTSSDPTPCTTCDPVPNCPTCTSTDLPQTPAIDLLKDGTYVDSSLPAGVSVGDTITYAFTVTNIGNVTLTNVTVTDPLVTVVGGPIPTLAVGASNSTTFTALYTVTQADIDAGQVNNLATATGTPPTGPPVTDTSSDPTPCTTCDPVPNCPTCTSTDLPQTPAIDLLKDGTYVDSSLPAGVSVGDTITYAFTVTNIGNVTLTNVTVTDPLVTVVGGPIPTLAVGASNSTTFTALYTVTQADIDAGQVNNLATATGTPPTGPPVTDTSSDPTPCTTCDPVPNCPTCTSTDLPQTPAIDLLKDGTYVDSSLPAGVSVGDTITYAFTVTNIGNVTLTNVTVTDPLVTVVGGPIPTLAVGASNSTTFTALYTVTQADIDAGQVNNLATATGTPPTGPPVTDTSSDPTPCTTCDPVPNCPTCTSTDLPQTPAIDLLKDGTYVDSSLPAGVSVGDTITYAFTVTNIGNVTLTNVTVTDPLVTVVGGPIPTLAVGASNSTTFTALYTVTQADIDAGQVNNLATATGTPPTGPPVTDTSSDPTPCTTCDPVPNCPTCTSTDLPQTPAIDLLKDGTYVDSSLPAGVSVGDTITYAFTVTNIGNVTLTNVTVTDPLVTVVGGPIPTLAVGASNSTTFTALYTVTQADIDAGQVNNLATATGTPPTGPPVTDTSSDPTPCTTCDPVPNCPTCTSTDLPQTPAIDLLKDGTYVDSSLPAGVSVGDTITYAFTVTNIGNVTLTNVTVTDPLVTVVGGPIPTLAVGASNSTTFTALYTVTQADIDAGQVNNLATATGTPPTGPPVTDTSSDPTPCTTCDPVPNCPTCTSTDLPQTPAIDLLKDGTYVDSSLPAGVSVGDTITYAFTVTNIGNVTLTNVTVTDPLVTVVGGPIPTLAVGASNSTTFTALYTVTQADIDAGQVNNLATATGTPPTGPPVTDTSSDPTPCTTCDPVPNCPTCTSTDLPQTPAIDLLKDGTYVDSSLPAGVSVGDTITYAFTVTNIGNVTLTNVTVTDPLVTVVGGPIPTLAVGASNSTTFTALYTVTQADIDAGQVNNLATATGTPPTGPPVTDTSSDPTPCTTCDPVPNCPTCTSTDLPQTPAIDLLKDGTYVDSSLPAGVSVGDTITYAFTVTNIGNVTLTNVTVTDPLVTVVGGPIPTLAVGASNSTTFTALYTVTQADIDAGQVNNLATATGTPPTGPPVTDTSSDPTPCTTCDPVPNCPTCTSTDLPQTPAIDLLKDGTYVDSSLPAGVSVGDTITYAFTVTNIGNVTLTNVTVTDPLVTVVGGPIPTLAVGASNSTTFTALYTVTQADIDAGQVNNLATATGTPPTGPPVTDTSSDPTPCTTCDPVPNCPTCTSTDLPQTPAIDLLKDGTYVDSSLPAGVSVGDTITYAFTVTNIGNVTLTNVTVTDPLVTVVGGPIPTLAVGASNSTTFTALYTVTQADIDAGQVNNLATATGTPPTGPPVTDTSSDPTPCTTCDPVPNCPTCTSTDLPQTPAIDLLKDGTYVDSSLPAGVSVGDTITYTFTVTNIGNVTLTNVTVTDPLVTVVGGPIPTLAVGASNSTTFTALYTVTQADIDAGQVNNLATATGTPPTGPPVTDTSSDPTPCTTCDPVPNCPTCTSTDLPQTPAIDLLKDGTYVDNNGDGITNVGDSIVYNFTVTNIGNVTLTNVTITDINAVVSGGPIPTLAVGASNSTTFTAVHIITQADIDAGQVNNLATATGTPPSGTPVTDTSSDPTPCDTCTTVPNCPTCTSTPLINAVNDTFNNVACDVSGVIGNILGNDTIGTTLVNTNPQSQVTLTILNGSNPNITIANNGAITVQSGIAFGTYTFTYQICSVSLPVICDQATVTINIVDTTPPTITLSAINQTVQCGPNAQAALLAWLANNGGAVATDTCSAVTWSNNFNGLSDGCGQTGTATVVFTAIDASNNPSTTTATFTIEDTTPPTITTVATNVTVQCDGNGNTQALQAWLASNGGAVATDACSNVTWTNNFTALSDTCGQTGTATVLFTATDDCGNAVPTTATFTIEDTTPPTITTAATNLTVQCDGNGNTQALQAWLASNGGAVATDACSNVTWTNNFTALSDTCGQTGTATVLFTATDDCGNATPTTATFTIEDTTPPTITTAATNLTVQCDGNGNTQALQAWLASNGGAVATDACSNVTWTNNFTALSDTCGQTGTATVLFTATDDCGNAVPTTATFTIQDTTQPTITSTAVNTTVQCDGNGNTQALQAWLASNGGAVATDACSNVTWTNNYTALSNGCGQTGTATVTFTATDDCGNASPTTATFTIQDSTPPTITTFAVNSTIECTSTDTTSALNAWLASNGGAAATDACSNVTWTNNFTALSDGCGQSGSATVTFIATDDCGNSIPTTATFTIQDTIAPTLDPNGPALVTVINVACDAIPAVPQLQFIDGCSAFTEIVITQSSVTSTVSDTGTYTIIRTWTVSDACGNVAPFSQTINVTIPNYIRTYTYEPVCNIDDTLVVKFTDVINEQFPGVITPNGTWSEVGTTISGALNTSNGEFTPLDVPEGIYIIQYNNNDPICPRIIQITIEVDREACTVANCVTLTVHNAFTPNNDGINEVFFIDNITNPCYAENTVEIYNRWGVKVFDTENYNNVDRVFTGISEGRSTVKQSAELPTGTYFYILKYRNVEGDYSTKNGYLYLSR